MNKTTAAATRLAEILARENTALRAMDFPAATALHDAKAQALTALNTALDQEPPPTDPAPVAERLKTLAADNRDLLAMALGVQGRVIEVIAGSIARRMAQAAPAYGRPAIRAPSTRPAAIAVLAQA